MKAIKKVEEINIVFLLTIFVYIICSTMITSIGERIQINKVALLVLSQSVLIIPTIVYVLYNKINVAELIRFKKLRMINVVLLVVFTFFIMPFINLVNAISMLFVNNNTDEIVTNIVKNYPLVVAIAVIAVVPAILEESVYRGVFFNEYRKVNVLKGILLSGLLFGLLHMNINQFSYAFIMGIIFAFVIEATDSILSTMIIHFAINCYSVVMVSSVGSTDMTRENLIQSVVVLAAAAAIMTPIAFLLYYLIAKKAKRWEHIKSIFKKNPTDSLTLAEKIEMDPKGDRNSKKTRMITLPLAIAIGICILLMVVGELIG